MNRTEKGRMAWSLAGHDKGKLYVIIAEDEKYAYLSDGRQRPLENPKKKSWKHIQLIKRVPTELKNLDWDHIKNEEIKHTIKVINSELFRR